MSVRVQACHSHPAGTPFSAGLFVYSVGPPCHSGAWPALRGLKACSPIKTMGQEPAHHQLPWSQLLET